MARRKKRPSVAGMSTARGPRLVTETGQVVGSAAPPPAVPLEGQFTPTPPTLPSADTEESKRAGTAVIQAREKLASQFLASGQFQNPTKAREAAARQLQGQEIPGEAPLRTVEEAQAAAKRAEEEIALPEPTELSPTREGVLENIPVVGPAALAISNVLANMFYKGWFSKLQKTKFDGPLTEETLREAALTEIRDEALNEGISASEGFGAIVEGIPVAGSLVSKYASGLIETPSGNAATIIRHVNSERQRASILGTQATAGELDPEFVLEQLSEIEDNLSWLEGRLKALINASAILMADADQVDLMEEKILRARERVLGSRARAEAALEGAGVPTNEQLYFTLSEYKEGGEE